MLPEDFEVQHSDHIVFILFVIVIQQFQDFKFDPCLMLESFLVSDYFDSDHLLKLVIKAFESLAEAA